MRRWVLLTLFLLSARVGADPSCLPDFVSLQATEKLSSPQQMVHSLKSSRGGVLFQTDAVMDSSYDGETLKLRVRFTDPTALSLPYNLYAVLVIVNGEVVSWQDLTGQCSGSGQSIFPGQTIELQPVKIRSQGLIQFSVWGKL